MYLYEMHCHEKTGSRCGSFSPKELVKTYQTQGFTGIVVTNHFFNGSCAVDHSLCWKDKVEQFCKGYELAKAEGDKVGLDVFFGFEYSVNNNPHKGFSNSDINSPAGCDFLIYGLGKEWLLSKDESILDMSANDFFEMVRLEGGFVVQAHPFRLVYSYMDHISLFPKFTDGIEVLNSTPNTMGRANKLAKAYAKAYSFYRIAGSDAHGNDREYFAVTKTLERAKDIHDLIRQIKERTVKLSLKKNKLCKK